MKTIDDMYRGYRRFRAGVYHQQAALYRELAQGQNPAIMLIGCADSRSDPSDIFDAAPGEMFVVRNVANLVPPYRPDGGLHGVSAALEFAVNILQVSHVVVLGHGGCGGVSASLSGASNPLIGEFVAPWVKLLDAARARVLAQDPPDPQYALELEGIESSLQNLMTFPFIARRVEEGSLTLHGAWFAIRHGELHWRNAQTGHYEVVAP
jgi:carbonic anhydrase